MGRSDPDRANLSFHDRLSSFCILVLHIAVGRVGSTVTELGSPLVTVLMFGASVSVRSHPSSLRRYLLSLIVDRSIPLRSF
jgi:hypothetical protein